MSVIDAIIARKLCGGSGGSVPKPLTYDYMPEGYPTKAMGTATVMEEQVVEFVSPGDGTPSTGSLTATFTPVEGQTYTVNWDGTKYECVCSIFNGSYLVLGNLSIIGAGNDTGEPFIYVNVPSMGSEFETFDTSPSHTISVKKTGEIVTPIAEEFLPVASEDNYGAVKKSEIVTSYEFDTAAPHDLMVKAITEFREGRASIMWSGHLIASSEHDPSTDKITVAFADDPYRVSIKTNINGYYSRTRGDTEFKELETYRVQLRDMNTNDQNARCLLTAEGTASDMALKIAAKHLRLDGFEILTKKELYLESSTTDSTKKFKITVDDSGTISAIEVT